MAMPGLHSPLATRSLVTAKQKKKIAGQGLPQTGAFALHLMQVRRFSLQRKNQGKLLFSSYVDFSSERLIPGIGPSHSLNFSIDVGGSFHENEKVNDEKFEISVVPPGHFVPGPLTDREKISKVYDNEEAR